MISFFFSSFFRTMRRSFGVLRCNEPTVWNGCRSLPIHSTSIYCPAALCPKLLQSALSTILIHRSATNQSTMQSVCPSPQPSGKEAPCSPQQPQLSSAPQRSATLGSTIRVYSPNCMFALLGLQLSITDPDNRRLLLLCTGCRGRLFILCGEQQQFSFRKTAQYSRCWSE